jgi:hypothetical protein
MGSTSLGPRFLPGEAKRLLRRCSAHIGGLAVPAFLVFVEIVVLVGAMITVFFCFALVSLMLLVAIVVADQPGFVRFRLDTVHGLARAGMIIRCESRSGCAACNQCGRGKYRFEDRHTGNQGFIIPRFGLR